MKGLILGLLMMVSGIALADATVPLTQPALAGIGIAGRTACVGSAFNSDNSVTGACHTVRSSACSGRGCQPVTYTTNYIAVWDANGTALSVTACSVTRHHLPQANQTTALNGIDPSDCTGLIFNPTGTVVVIDAVPYYYVSTDAVTGAQLVNSNSAGYLILPTVSPDAPGKFY